MRLTENNKAQSMFVLSSVLLAGFVMLLSMGAGEVFVREDLFAGFLKNPSMWAWIFTETMVWTLPVLILGSVVLQKVKTKSPYVFALTSTLFWFVSAIVVVLIYRQTHFSAEIWAAANYTAENIFGWVIPSLLIWIIFVTLSMDLRGNQKID